MATKSQRVKKRVISLEHTIELSDEDLASFEKGDIIVLEDFLGHDFKVRIDDVSFGRMEGILIEDDKKKKRDVGLRITRIASKRTMSAKT